jgi:phenylalanyl-tRNA synthetase beta chain
MDVAAAKGFLELLASRVVGVRLAYEPVVVREGIEHPGRSAAVVAVAADGTRRVVGRVGELHPGLLEAAGVRGPHVAFAEIELEALLSLRPERQRVGRLEGLPGMERDIALVVSGHQRAGALEAIIREQGGPHLRSVRLFDLYAGPPLDPDERSVAYRLRFEAVDGELSEGDVEAAVERVVGVLSERLGARLRA